MPRVVLTDFTDHADMKAAVALLVAAGADEAEALAALDTLLAGVPVFVDVEWSNGVVADLANMGIEAEVMVDDGATAVA